MSLSRHAALSAGLYPMADEGTFFTAVNPTPGTGIAQSIVGAFSATDGVLTIQNGATATNRLYINHIRLIPTVVPASATRSELLISIDSATRYSSGGSSLTAKNVAMGSSTASAATVKFGALTLAAETGNVRRICRAELRSAIPVAFEEYVIDFGKLQPLPATLGGTTAQRNVTNAPPAVLEANHSLQVHLWHPSNAATAASWEVEVGWWER
jgi:hypothetical protein